MMIQCELSQGFAGSVNWPVNVAPAARATVSPQFALFGAVCRLLPALTLIVVPGAGVLASVVCMKVTGNCAGPSYPPEPGGGGGAETARLNDLLVVLLPASVTWAVNVKLPVCAVVPDRLPVLVRTNPVGSAPEATFHW